MQNRSLEKTKIDDATLIQRLLAREQDAYTYVVTTYQNNLLQVARGIVGMSIAEEVVQEAWIAAFRALANFEQRSSLKTWLIRIVSNCAKTRLRQENRSINFSEFAADDETILDPANFTSRGHWQAQVSFWDFATPDELLSNDQLKACIDLTIRDLPANQRSVLTLRDMQSLEMHEICKILDISESNARVLLHRARNIVREAIDNFLRK